MAIAEVGDIVRRAQAFDCGGTCGNEKVDWFALVQRVQTAREMFDGGGVRRQHPAAKAIRDSRDISQWPADSRNLVGCGSDHAAVVEHCEEADECVMGGKAVGNGFEDALAATDAGDPVVGEGDAEMPGRCVSSGHPRHQSASVGRDRICGNGFYHRGITRARSGRLTLAVISTNNRIGLDYRSEAASFATFQRPLVDIHAHINGATASKIYAEVQKLYGVRQTYSMTQLPACAAVREVMGDKIRFMCIPTFSDPDKGRAFRHGYVDAIKKFSKEFDAKVMKIWSSPRLRDLVPDGRADVWEIDSEWRVRQVETALSLGMMVMIHIADPNTWFSTKWSDSSKYDTKAKQYESLERMLSKYQVPWIAAHMGGWPEDLAFLSGLLTRHRNLYLDTSATKWMIRELSKHSREEIVAFLTKFKGRILFGSDIVTMEDHVTPKKAMPESIKSDQASSPEAAFDLYASRYYALRTMWEKGGERESAIADEDLGMVDPAKYNAMSAPMVRGFDLPRELLESLYFAAGEKLMNDWEQGTWKPV